MNIDEFLDLAHKRRSIRAFKPDPVPEHRGAHSRILHQNPSHALSAQQELDGLPFRILDRGPDHRDQLAVDRSVPIKVQGHKHSIAINKVRPVLTND